MSQVFTDRRANLQRFNSSYETALFHLCSVRQNPVGADRNLLCFSLRQSGVVEDSSPTREGVWYLSTVLRQFSDGSEVESFGVLGLILFILSIQRRSSPWSTSTVIRCSSVLHRPLVARGVLGRPKESSRKNGSFTSGESNVYSDPRDARRFPRKYVGGSCEAPRDLYPQKIRLPHLRRPGVVGRLSRRRHRNCHPLALPRSSPGDRNAIFPGTGLELIDAFRVRSAGIGC